LDTSNNPSLTIEKKKSLYQISFLRMIAAVSVCLFHIVNGNTAFISTANPVARVCRYGYLGVDVFFIISGFIICYSLPTDYSLKNLPVFVKKRLIRVEPPYLVSIILTLLVAFIAALYTHNPINVSWINLLYHIGYINNFTTNSYINVVYWTLGIEFQFYILIGLLFGVMNRSIYCLTFIILAFLGLSFISIKGTNLIFEQLPLFCAGILIFYISFSERYSKPILILLLIITFGIIAHSDLSTFFTSLFTIAVILIPMRKYKVVSFLATISYSLYLVHVPVGGRVINWSLRFVKTDMQRYWIIALALAVCIITAYFFYILIEKWTTNISKKIKYSKAD
jgi:peptidoglycan/LPS O-acetylase OafA/YrhL